MLTVLFCVVEEQKTCAPPADMCAQPLTLANGFVSYQFPLGLDFYTEADMTSKASIFLEFMVSVQDAENKLTGATALVQIPLEQAGHVTWCESEGASTDLLNVANIDIVIGTAETQGQLETQLTVLQNVMYSDASATTKAHSLQSGLISVVLKGSDSFFELPRAQNFYLELEDVVSLHFLETTNTKFDAVKALIDQGLAFETVVDAQGKANINPTIALLDLCPSDGSDMSCLSRRDVYKRASSFPSPVDTSSSQHGNTALEINPENTDNAKSFMATMLGTSSSWASGLGTAFSDILASKYDLNLRHKRAWWINPGSDWSKGTTPKFTLPSKMIVAMLVNLNEAGHVRRRTLVTSGSHSTTTTKTIPTPPRHVMQYTVERAGKVRLAPQMSPAKVSATSSELNFHVNPAEQIMTALGVDKSKSTTFQVEYVMPSDLLCMPEVEAKNKLGQTLLAGMKKAADVENVIVTSISVPAESKAECKRRFQRMSRTLKSAGAVAKIEILVVFSSAGHMVVNQAAFLASTPGMLALTPTDTSSAGKLSMDNSYVPPAAQLDKPVVAGTIAVPEVLSVSEGGGVPAMTVALGCTGAMALLATASALVMRRRAKLNTQRPTSSTLKVHSDDIESAPKTHCKPLVKEQDEVMCISGGISPVGPAPGARLRRSNSHEEMMLNQELGVKTLERTASGEAVLGIALHESIVSSSRTSTDRSFSRASSGCRPASAATSLFGSMATKPQNTAKTEKKFDFAERLAYITALVSGSSDQANEGPVTFGVAGPKGPAKNPASSIETAASGSPQKIKMKLDVVDWFGSRNSSVLSALSTDGASSPTRSIHSPDGSRSSSPLLKPWNRDRSRSPLRSDGTTSPTGSFKASKAYRGDLAAREMRQDRLHSAFDIPDEVSGNECSVKELKNTLRSLGVTETDILRCMEKSELQNLRITAETPKEIVPKVSGDDVESMLFRTQSGGEKTQLRFAQLLQLKPSTAL